MHMALQIFPPNNSFLGHDGLYKVRKWVFAIWILFPCFTAALAFANPDGAYQAQGAFCWLPIRPFWYRLALSWVPRYLIWLYIMWVAIRIYSHVGYEFRVFGQERDRSSSTDLSAVSSAERGAIEKAVKEHHSRVKSNEKVADDEIAPDDASMPGPMFASFHIDDQVASTSAGRRMSLPTWHSPFGGTSSPKADISITPTAISNPTSRRGSRQIAPGVVAEDFMAPPGFDSTHPRGSVSTMNSVPQSINGASADPTLPPIVEGRTSTSHASSVDTDIGARALRQRRRAIQRQLRILFIYPVVYMGMWLIPFTSHCLSYSDYFAQHPTVPLDTIVADVNLDMPVLLYRFEDMTVFGAERSTLGPIVRRAVNSAGVGLTPDGNPEEAFFVRSDHYRFVERGIPSVFLWPGQAGPGKAAVADFMSHRYHKVGDEIDQGIDWSQGPRFVSVNYAIAREIADAPERPVWNKGDYFGLLFDGPMAP